VQSGGTAAAHIGDGGSLGSVKPSEENGGSPWQSTAFYLYTAAAPTYFPSVDGYIDGGVYANNPSMCALAQTQDDRYFDPPTKINDVVLLSLGTGTSLFHIKKETLDWGYVQWIKPLTSLMLDGISAIAHYQSEQILRDRYHRLAPVFPSKLSATAPIM